MLSAARMSRLCIGCDKTFKARSGLTNHHQQHTTCPVALESRGEPRRPPRVRQTTTEELGWWAHLGPGDYLREEDAHEQGGHESAPAGSCLLGRKETDENKDEVEDEIEEVARPQGNGGARKRKNPIELERLDIKKKMKMRGSLNRKVPSLLQLRKGIASHVTNEDSSMSDVSDVSESIYQKRILLMERQLTDMEARETEFLKDRETELKARVAAGAATASRNGPKVSAKEFRESVFGKEVEKYTKEVAFPRCKFIPQGGRMEGGKNMWTAYLLPMLWKHLKVAEGDDRRVSLQAEVKACILHAMCQKRNNVQQDLKRVFLATWGGEHGGKAVLLEPAEMLKFRTVSIPEHDEELDSDADKTTRLLLKSWYWFVTQLVRGTAGRKVWSSAAMKLKHLSDVVPALDEAFALLLYENNYAKWCWAGKGEDLKANNGDARSEYELPPAGKFTSKGSTWSDDGMRRFAEIHTAVCASRVADKEHVWEKFVLNATDNRAKEGGDKENHGSTDASKQPKLDFVVPNRFFESVDE